MKTEDEPRRCQNCEWFDQFIDENYPGERSREGYCVINPPRVVRWEDDYETVWPVVSITRRCGKWERKR